MNLSNIFSAIAYKELAQVDLPGRSHQHEVNGSGRLKSFFRTSEAVSGIIRWYYFADNVETLQEDGTYTFYDPRARSVERTGRSEWRLYYTGKFLQCADPGDVLILARTANTEEIYGLVFQSNSNILRAAKSLLVLEDTRPLFQHILPDELSERELEATSSLILNQLGIPLNLPVKRTDEELVVQKFGKSFPTTARLSLLAREEVDVDLSNPDETLLRWIQREEELFRALEKIVVQEKLDNGFEGVDDFIKYSLSVQNRRKSRMGYALQNHLKVLLEVYKVSYTSQAKTEGKNTPDFLFPGKREYHNLDFNSEYLTMLAAKSTVKERWRQILTEANRIPEKHLCTLEPGISVDQTNEMKQQKVKLVIPAHLLEETYTEAQQKEAITISNFLSLVLSKQKLTDSL